MTNDHKNAIGSIERALKSIWIELEGLSLSVGVDKQHLEAAKDSAQDLISNAKFAVQNDV